MRLLVNLIAVLALIWPVPFAARASAAGAPMTHVGTSHAAVHDAMAAEHAHHAPAASEPIKRDGRHMADCCIGAACFGFGLIEYGASSFAGGSAPSIVGKEIRLVAVTRAPDPPPPRL